ncbi:hypothetical protein V4C85_20640 [Ralstonia solanacearum]|uniref:Uncharacterized protein n=1 Tax=Ralstonia solanacearum TaxID=305 RepID=A0AAW5ZLP1_RALSL|nr:hypothetical protein [Ralstonia solanacearum]MDB0570679.1 hypothetical protein [Ralstonia solanacearum]
MGNVWKGIQPLRVASGWVVDVNNFYEFDPLPENMEWFYGSVLISGHHVKTGLCFDSRYEPEGDPKGEYVLDFIEMKINKKTGDVESEAFIGSRRTRSRVEFIEWIESFMFVGKGGLGG